MQQEGTVKPYAKFNAEQDAEVLHKATKGLGTDEEAITNTLCYRTNTQRQQVVAAYKTMFGKVGVSWVCFIFKDYEMRMILATQKCKSFFLSFYISSI